MRIAMWSGPRNLSTALMRAFENRADCAVVDEPFYAAYLAETGIDHPMRVEVLQSQSTDWRCVADELLGPVPGGKRIFYQKHMTHHMLPGFGRDWMIQCRNAFLIRAPAQVLLSYAARRETVGLADIGFTQQAALFDMVCDRLGGAPPVLDAADLRRDPGAALQVLCGALGIAFAPSMLSWPPGARATDGAWAPAWYDGVRRSTGFAPQVAADTALPELPPHLRTLQEAAEPHYRRLAQFRLDVPAAARDGAANRR